MSHPSLHRAFPLAWCMALLIVGCDSRKPPVGPAGRDVGPARDADATILLALENRQDAAQCRTILQQLDNYDAGVAGRLVLSDTERAEISTFLPLSEAEWNEITKRTFSLVDASYLEECLLVRSAVKSLGIDGLPPAERAAAAFDWVCRTVYLDDRVPWPAPPWMTLHGGCGVPMARTYAILAAWQQLGLDGFVVGPEGLKSAPSYVPPDPRSGNFTHAELRTMFKYAPVRACGVKSGKDILLFDPASGKAIPGLGGKGIATLAQIRANPDEVKGLGPASEIKDWQVCLAPPLNGLARRMEWLDQRNPGNVAVKLFVDVAAIRTRYLADAGPGATCDAWNPPADAFSATRILALYAAQPAKEKAALPLRDQHKFQLIPLDKLPTTILEGDAKANLWQQYVVRFQSLRYTSNSVRDHMLRGNFQEATALLTDVKAMADAARTRAESDKSLQADFDLWAQGLQHVISDMLRAKEGRRGALPLAEAQQAYMTFMEDPRGRDVHRAYVMAQATRPLAAEALYLLASCVHERAERAALRGTATSGNWQNARDWWERYADAAAQTRGDFEARDRHALSLAARCDERLRK